MKLRSVELPSKKLNCAAAPWPSVVIELDPLLVGPANVDTVTLVVDIPHAFPGVGEGVVERVAPDARATRTVAHRARRDMTTRDGSHCRQSYVSVHRRTCWLRIDTRAKCVRRAVIRGLRGAACQRRTLAIAEKSHTSKVEYTHRTLSLRECCHSALLAKQNFVDCLSL